MSHSEWFGSLPAHWEVKPARALFDEMHERGHPDEQLLSVTIASGVIAQRALLASGAKKDSSNEDKSGYKLVRPGDIAYNKMRAWQGAIGLSADRGIVSPAYVVVRPRAGWYGRYVHYLLRTPAFATEAERWSYGITSDQWSLRPEDFKMIRFPVPPVDEQRVIARVLDHIDRRIRRAIYVKQKMIALLNEQKQSVIQRAVTRGADPNVRLEPSGVEWLGHLPAHWAVMPFKRCIGFREGPGIMADDFRDEGVPLLRISCLRGNEASLSGCNYLDPREVQARWKRFAIHAGDYLLSSSGSLGAVTKATELVAGAIPYTGIIRLWPINYSTVDMDYVRYFMSSELFGAQIRFLKAGVGIEHFGPTHLNRMLIVLPPADEQRRLVQALDARVAEIDAAVSAGRREVELLNEYRTRLIADVVTGKRDVREAAARLPDEVDELEPLEAGEVDHLAGEDEPELVEA